MLAPWIIEHFPPHRTYVEPFGGGASVLMRKARSFGEVYNDIDSEIVNVFRIMQSRADDLERILRVTPFARDEFDLAYEPTDDSLERARRTIIRSFLGFSAVAVTRKSKTGFRGSPQACHTHPATDWIGYPDNLKQFTSRLMGVVIENKDARELMAALDNKDTLFFVDPPYVHGSRVELNGYRHEMSDEDHLELCGFLKDLKGMVILSGYESSLYEKLGWVRVSRDALAMNGAKRTEVLWLNAAAWSGQAQMSLPTAAVTA